MKPIKFKECNTTYAKNQPQYNPLSAYRDTYSSEGYVVSCWKMSFIERLRILFTGKLWVNMMMFSQPLTPSRLSTKKSDAFEGVMITNTLQGK